VADPRAHPRLPARGRVRAAHARALTTSLGWRRYSPRATHRSTPPAPPARSSRAAGRWGSCSAGITPTPATARSARRFATGCRRICARPLRPGLRHAPLHLALPARRRAGGGARQSDRSRGHAHRLGRRRVQRLPGPDGRSVKPKGLLGTAYIAAMTQGRHQQPATAAAAQHVAQQPRLATKRGRKPLAARLVLRLRRAPRAPGRRATREPTS
jgi:hypothetical protein